MTSTVKVTAHCASTKEVRVTLNDELVATLQDTESSEFYVYDARVISVTEVNKPTEA